VVFGALTRYLVVKQRETFEMDLQDGMSVEGVSPVEQEAIQWVVRMTSGDASEFDRLAFRNWRARNAENEAALVVARSLWVSVGWGMADPGLGRHRETVFGSHRASSRAPRRLALAAAILLVSMLGYLGLHDWRYDDVTSVGERRAISLADGTRVELNSGTALSVDFSAGYRRVALARGEAYFDVTHDATRPFIVKAAAGEVRVLGTAFSVRKDDEGVVVTVTRGRVQVADGGATLAVVPEQQVRYNTHGLSSVGTVDSYNVLGWRRSRLVVEAQSLAQIVAELNRYYPGRIVLTADEAGSKLLNAVIDLDHIDDWLQSLEQSQPVKVTRVGPLTFVH
jgi:transmembrane sensor